MNSPQAPAEEKPANEHTRLCANAGVVQGRSPAHEGRALRTRKERCAGLRRKRALTLTFPRRGRSKTESSVMGPGDFTELRVLARIQKEDTERRV